MEVCPDFKELLALFNAHAVDYVIVGAHALAYHGAPRFTGDMAIYVRPDIENGRKIVSALQAFGFGSHGLTENDFSVVDRVVQLGYPPVRINIMTSISGVSWDEVVAGKVAGEYADVSVSFIGRRQLTVNKRASARKKDFADIEALGEE